MQVKASYRGTLDKNAIGMAASTTPSTTAFTEIGRYTVSAGQAVMLGFGAQSGQDNAQGRIFAKIQSTPPAVLDGVIRIDWHDAQDRPKGTLGEWRTETLNTSATDPTMQIPLPVQNPALTQDRSLVVKFKGDAATALTLADSTLLISYTNLDV